jgi:AraC family transcriptional regulator
LVDHTPDLTSYDAGWRGITLETFKVPSGETPECCLDNCTIGIYLGPDPDIRVRQITENRCEQVTFLSGSTVIFPMRQPHFFEWNKNSRALCLTLKPELLHSSATELLGGDRVELLPKFGFRDGLIYQIGLALRAELQTSASSDRLYAETLTHALAVHLIKHYSTLDEPSLNCKGALSSHKLRLVIDYINDNLERELSLQALAAIAQLSQYHFCRAFKRSTGLSPHKYLTQQRVERVKQLLQQRSMTLAEISVACGFTHQSHLHRHFKRLTGVTPMAWMRDVC